MAGGGSVDVDVDATGSGVTIGSLVSALDVERSVERGPVWVDDRVVPADASLLDSGVLNGSTIRTRSGGRVRGRALVGAGAVRTARVVGGVEAGGRISLGTGDHQIGRDPAASIAVTSRTTSRAHARVRVDPDAAVSVRDSDSMAGTFVGGRDAGDGLGISADDVVTVGAAQLVVGPAVVCEPALLGAPDAWGRRPLRRPPRPVVSEPGRLVAPVPRDSAHEAPRFSWAAAVVPLVAGLVLARLVDPRLALFSALGPLVLVGQWVEERRRHRRTAATARAQDREDLSEFAKALTVAEADEVRRRRRRAPDPSVLGAHIEARATSLWSRRADDGDRGLVSVGVAPALRWNVPVAAMTGPPAALVETSRLVDAPIEVRLWRDDHVGLAGDRTAVLAVARWIVIQLAAHHGPADLRIGAMATPDRADDWSWLALLPHCEAPSGKGLRLLASDADGVRRVVELVRPLLDREPLHADGDHAPHLVVIVDGITPNEGPGRMPSTLTLADAVRAVPSRCNAVVELASEDGWLRSLETAEGPCDGGLATGVSASRARELGRSLAGLSDPDAPERGAGVDGRGGLLDVLGLAGASIGELVEAVSLRWSTGGSVLAPIGTADGPQGSVTFFVDLERDGPHALVGGTTGSGKSELLRTLVAGLAVAAPPDRMTFVLVDYKGGAAFGGCRDLPHVLAVVTDLDDGGAARALRSLEAELRRRERVLAELGLRDIAEHPAHREGGGHVGEPLPRLVIVVDELGALVAELPELVDGLVGIAARGRTLGIHLVLGTQRPAGVVNGAIRTNCTLRICLRMPEEADAVDLVGSTLPSRLDRRQPGRAYVRSGASDLTEVQVALVSGSRSDAQGSRLVVRPIDLCPDPWPVREESAGEATDLDLLVGACGAAASARGGAPPIRPWVDPLRDHVSVGEVRAVRTRGATEDPRSVVALGLVDRPDEQRYDVLAWEPASGPLVALGASEGGAFALRAAARIWASQLEPSMLHIHCLDMCGGLADVGELPHVGAAIRAGERERIHRLVRLLKVELEERQATPTAADRPDVLVLVNGVAALRSALDGLDGLAALDALERVIVDGPRHGLFASVAADRPGSVPASWRSAASLLLAFRLGDPTDLLSLGGGRIDQRTWPAGRCVDVGSGLIAQVVTKGFEPSRPMTPATVLPDCVGVLPDEVELGPLLGVARRTADRLLVPVGLGADDLQPVVVGLTTRRGLLVVGRSGSGRTTLLRSVAHVATALGCHVVGPDDERPPLDAPVVMIVDDTDVAAAPEGTVIRIVAVTPEQLREPRNGWLATMRSSAVTVLLQPHGDLDAHAIGLALLPRSLVRLDLPGRAVLVDGGRPQVLHIAREQP
jgi:S-DNA-T family DNA segregation ATPase FtsK/SpoIIIE